jgi:hypothetical protein
MYVVEHRSGRQVLPRRHLSHAPIELGPIVDVVGQMRQLVLHAAGPRGLP